MAIKTKEVGKTALQMNGVAFTVRENSVFVLLLNGNTVKIECPDKETANEVKNTLMYYPLNSENSGHEFKKEVKISIIKEQEFI